MKAPVGCYILYAAEKQARSDIAEFPQELAMRTLVTTAAVGLALAVAGCNQADQRKTQADTQAATQDVKASVQNVGNDVKTSVPWFRNILTFTTTAFPRTASSPVPIVRSRTSIPLVIWLWLG